MILGPETSAWKMGFDAGRRDPDPDLVERIVRLARDEANIDAGGVLAAARRERHLERQHFIEP